MPSIQGIFCIFSFGLVLLFPKVINANNFYIGTDLSQMKFDQNEFDTTNIKSILAGYTFDNWSIEGSYSTSKTHNQFYNGDQKVDMFHLYSVYRSQGDLYYKIKLGITNERYKVYGADGKLQFDDVHSGIARGIGVGYKYGQYSIEIEYSWLGLSLETIGVGIRYSFN